MMQLNDKLTPQAQRLLDILKCVCPLPPTEDERLLLCHILYHQSDMTSREVAYFVGRLIGLYYLDVIGDVDATRMPDFVYSQNALDALRERLRTCGYDAWLAENG